MSDDDAEEESEPAVELGDADPVEGAPLARVTSRLTWGIEQSELVRKEGDAVIRTPDGPRELADVLEDVDQSYFETRQDLAAAVTEAVGLGPVDAGDAGQS
jgi:hypothetical protein